MKEDILEQIVTDYLGSLGYFTLTNVKYRPIVGSSGYVKNDDAVHSDIDVIGYHPKRDGPQRVVIVNCKSWQSGFWPKWEIERMFEPKHQRWKPFREIASSKWAAACRAKVFELTGEKIFEHWIACVTVPEAEMALWTSNTIFQKCLSPHLKIITLHEMMEEIAQNTTTTQAGSDIGRMIQLMKATKRYFASGKSKNAPRK